MNQYLSVNLCSHVNLAKITLWCCSCDRYMLRHCSCWFGKFGITVLALKGLGNYRVWMHSTALSHLWEPELLAVPVTTWAKRGIPGSWVFPNALFALRSLRDFHRSHRNRSADLLKRFYLLRNTPVFSSMGEVENKSVFHLTLHSKPTCLPPASYLIFQGDAAGNIVGIQRDILKRFTVNQHHF